MKSRCAASETMDRQTVDGMLNKWGDGRIRLTVLLEQFD
jgi:hypothetical protein